MTTCERTPESSLPSDDEARIRHLLDAARSAGSFTAQRTRDYLVTDEMLRLALTKLVEIVGEAAKQVTDQTRADYPLVPWSQAARMRDRPVHHYFDIEVDVLWSTVNDDLPLLVELLGPGRYPPGCFDVFAPGPWRFCMRRSSADRTCSRWG